MYLMSIYNLTMFGNSNDAKSGTSACGMDKTAIFIVCMIVSLGVVGGYFMYTQQEKLKKYVEILTNKIEELNDSVKKCPVLAAQKYTQHKLSHYPQNSTKCTETSPNTVPTETNEQQQIAPNEIKLNEEYIVNTVNYDSKSNNNQSKCGDNDTQKKNQHSVNNAKKCRPLTNSEFEIIYKEEDDTVHLTSSDGTSFNQLQTTANDEIIKKKKPKNNLHYSNNIVSITDDDHNGNHNTYTDRTRFGTNDTIRTNSCNITNDSTKLSINTTNSCNITNDSTKLSNVSKTTGLLQPIHIESGYESSCNESTTSNECTDKSHDKYNDKSKSNHKKCTDKSNDKCDDKSNSNHQKCNDKCTDKPNDKSNNKHNKSNDTINNESDNESNDDESEQSGESDNEQSSEYDESEDDEPKTNESHKPDKSHNEKQQEPKNESHKFDKSHNETQQKHK